MMPKLKMSIVDHQGDQDPTHRNMFDILTYSFRLNPDYKRSWMMNADKLKRIKLKNMQK